MKSSVFIIAALLTMSLLGAQPALALSTDHDSAYANAGGSSRFSDPDDALDGSGSNQFGSMQLGNSSGNSNSFGSVTFGLSGSNDGHTQPGYAMQGCLSPACQR